MNIKRPRMGHLSIKQKLYLTYITGLLITILLMGLVAYITHGNRMVPPGPGGRGDAVNENLMSYSFQLDRLNSVESASRLMDLAVMGRGETGKQAEIISEDFWKAVDQEVSSNVSLVVFRDDRKIFQSDKLPQDMDTTDFPGFGDTKSYPNRQLFTSYGTTIQRQRDFITEDGARISAFILLSVQGQTGKLIVIVINNILIFMLVATIVMGVVSWFVVRSITRPLDQLKQAADDVRRGNLTHVVRHVTNDKIGEVSMAFEAMRVQLLENEKVRDQYEQNRQQMISSISHDLRTPVTAIKLHAEGILDGVADSPQKMSKYLRSMVSNAQVIDRLLKELTLLSNLDAQQESFQFSKVSMHRFMQDLVGEWAYDFEKEDVRFHVDMRLEKSETLLLDVVHFRRVLVNVIENALKYVQRRPLEIHIAVDEVGDLCQIRIWDNGLGVSEDQLEQIFERFHRVDQSRQANMPGSGLGLAIARHIILRHRGRIWAENHPDAGLEIVIELPLSKEG